MSNSTTEKASALVIAASDKAGMEGIDRDRVNAIILRESQGTAYMLRQQRQDQRTEAKIQEMQKRRMLLSLEQEYRIQKDLQEELDQLISTRNTLSTKIVLDMDSFYVSAALLSKDDDFKKLPVCVTGGSVILTSNYVARKYGVRSAMASWIGDKLVDELSGGKERLIHLPSDFELYTKLSHQVREIISEYDPNYKAYSLDEAYFDLAPYIELRRSRGLFHHEASSILRKRSEQQIDKECFSSCSQSISSAQIVSEIRQKIFAETGLTSSAGIASNFMLAKIASDQNKPNGQCFVHPNHEDILEFLEKLPIRKVPGIGRVTEKILHSFNIETVSDLYRERAVIQYLFKKATSCFLLRASIGWDDGSVSSLHEEEGLGRKGISRERTINKISSIDEIKAQIENIAGMLCIDMSDEGINARTVTLKVKLDTFDVLSRSKSLPNGCFIKNKIDEMLPILFDLLHGLQSDCSTKSFTVRLIGVRCSNLIAKSETSCGQIKLERFLTKRISQRKLDRFQKSDNKVSTSLTQISTFNQANKEEQSQDWTHTLTKILSCPICSQVFQISENDALNSHLDSCLNTSVIRKTIKQDSREELSRKKKKISDFFG